MTIQFQFLNNDTAPLLIAAAPEVLDGPVRPDSLKQFMDDPRHFMILAIEDEACVGMASANEYFHPDKLPQVFLNEIGVADARQRHGIGRALVREVMAEADRRGATYVWLGTEPDNAGGNGCFSKVHPPENWHRDEEEGDTFVFYGWEKD